MIFLVRRGGFSTMAESSVFNGAVSAAILVVEDDGLIREVIAERLRASGFQVLEAANAQEAARIIESGADVDFVFSDVRMPGEMDGFALARWIHAQRPGLPVLLTSGDLKRADAACELCESEFFEKPYDPDRIVAHIRASLTRKEP